MSPNVTKVKKTAIAYKLWTGEQNFLFNGKVQFGINLWQPFLTFLVVNFLMVTTLANTVLVS